MHSQITLNPLSDQQHSTTNTYAATSPLAPSQLHAHGAVLRQRHIGDGGGHQAAVQVDVLSTPEKKVV